MKIKSEYNLKKVQIISVGINHPSNMNAWPKLWICQ